MMRTRKGGIENSSVNYFPDAARRFHSKPPFKDSSIYKSVDIAIFFVNTKRWNRKEGIINVKKKSKIWKKKKIY